MKMAKKCQKLFFGVDLYPGQGIADPNSSLSLEGAAAHELTHWHRWNDKTELTHEDLYEIDEALTSLGAALRYPQLSQHCVRRKPKKSKTLRLRGGEPFHPASGFMKGLVRITPGIDLTQPADAEWADRLDAEHGGSSEPSPSAASCPTT
jgi:hypothetical protein